MLARYLAVALVALAPILTLGRPPAVGAAGGTSASATAHGIRITLAIPQATYPRNALAEVSVRITNVSSQPIGYYPGSICGSNPQVTVTNNRDIILYPPALGGAPIPSCGPAIIHLPQLQPRATRVWHLYAIVGGAHLQAFVSITRHQIYVYSPVLRVHLVAGPAPTATLHRSPELSLEVTPAGPTTGPLLYSSWWGCKVSNGAEFGGGGIGWQATKGDSITPNWNSACEARREWHVVAGWVGQRVVVVNVGKHVTP